jgi:hypothetical protein
MEIENTTNTTISTSSTSTTTTTTASSTTMKGRTSKSYNDLSYNSRDHMKELFVSIERSSSSSSSSFSSPSLSTSITTYYNNLYNYVIISMMNRSSIYIQHPTLLEWWYWISRFMTIITVITGLIFILYHDYD